MSGGPLQVAGAPAPEEAALLTACALHLLAEAQAAAMVADPRPPAYRSPWRRAAVAESSSAAGHTDHAPVWRAS